MSYSPHFWDLVDRISLMRFVLRLLRFFSQSLTSFHTHLGMLLSTLFGKHLGPELIAVAMSFCALTAPADPPKGVARDGYGAQEASFEISYPPKYTGSDTLGLRDPGIKMFRVRRGPGGLQLQVGAVISGTFGHGFVPLTTLKLNSAFQDPAIINFLNRLIDDPIGAHDWNLKLAKETLKVKVQEWHLIVNPKTGTIDSILPANLDPLDNWGKKTLATLKARFGVDGDDLKKQTIDVSRFKIDVFAKEPRLIPRSHPPTPGSLVRPLIAKEARRLIAMAKELEVATDPAEIIRLREELVRWLKSIPPTIAPSVKTLNWEIPRSTLEIIDLAHKLALSHALTLEPDEGKARLKARVAYEALERQALYLNSGLNSRLNSLHDDDPDSQAYARDRIRRFIGVSETSPFANSAENEYNDKQLVDAAYLHLKEFEQINTSGTLLPRPSKLNSKPAVSRPVTATPTDPSERNLRRQIGENSFNTPRLLSNAHDLIGAASTLAGIGFMTFDPNSVDQLLSTPLGGWSAAVVGVVFALPYTVKLASHAKQFAERSLLRMRLAAHSAKNRSGLNHATGLSAADGNGAGDGTQKSPSRSPSKSSKKRNDDCDFGRFGK